MVLMETRGGAMSGYCSSGRVKIDNPPASMMTMAKTQAKMGRLIKNCAMKDCPDQRVAPVGAAPGSCTGCGLTVSPTLMR